MHEKAYLLLIYDDFGKHFDTILSFHSLEAALDYGWQLLVKWDEAGIYDLEENDKEFWYEWQAIDGYIRLWEADYKD